MRIKLLAFLIALMASYGALAGTNQYCADVAGSWSDGAGHDVWTFTQSSTGVLGGTYVNSLCRGGGQNATWNLSGQFGVNGNFSVTATGPVGGPYVGCPGNFTNAGQLPLGTTACATITFNPGPNQGFLYENSCPYPQGESASTFTGWFSGNPGVAKFSETLNPPSGASFYNWSGRTVVAAMSGVVNTCAVTPTQSIVSSWYIDSTNHDDDLLGLPVVFDVNTIRALAADHNGAGTPCSLTETQTLSVDCPMAHGGPYQAFETHVVTLTVNPSTIQVQRRTAVAGPATFGTSQTAFRETPIIQTIIWMLRHF